VTVAWKLPERTEPRQWLDLFVLALHGWRTSRFSDTRAADAVVDALRYVLEKAPETGVLVSSLATAVLHEYYQNLHPSLAGRIVEVGLTAERLVPERRPLARAYLTVERGRVAMRTDRFLNASRDGLLALDALSDPAVEGTEFSAFVRAEAQLLRASALDALLDYGGAANLYQSARELATSYVEDLERIRQATIESMRLFFGDEFTGVLIFFGDDSAVEERAGRFEMELFMREVTKLLLAAAIGSARCAALGSGDDLETKLESAAAVVRGVGLGWLSPLDFALPIRHASAEVARTVAETLVGLAREQPHSAAAFQGVTRAAAACALDGEEAQRWLSTAREVQDKIEDPFAAAAAAGFALVRESSRSFDDPSGQDDALQTFLRALDVLNASRHPRLDDPRSRAVLDEPIGLALRAVGRTVATRPNASAWTTLELLIDFDINSRLPLDQWLPPPAVSADPGFHEIDMIVALLERSRLVRLRYALSDRRGTTAVIMRATDEGLLFICVSETGLIVSESDRAFTDGANYLRDLFEDQLEIYGYVGSTVDDEIFAEAGRNAYDLLPRRVRTKIDASDTILLCPDHRTGGDAVPYELFHDERGWLGTEKVIARFPSLRSLVRSVESTTRRNPHRRLLAVAVPESRDRPYLRFAASEVGEIRRLVEAADWDAPPIEAERVSAGYVMDRLPLATHLHLASHGEVEGTAEALILHGGERLTSVDFTARYLPRVPSAFLNSCSLATTRWAGGGKSSGVAHALLEAGSPAVIANLLPVDDEHSAALAVEFYRAALEADFGESLRSARSAMRDSVSPVLWCSTVLIGDPRTSLDPVLGPQSLTERILDPTVEPTDPERIEDIAEATEALAADPWDSRLKAALALRREIDSWDVTVEASRNRTAHACRVAGELNSLPALAALADDLARTYDDGSEEERRLVEGAIDLLEPLEEEEPSWGERLHRLLARAAMLRAGDRPPTLRTWVRPGEAMEGTNELASGVLDALLDMDSRELRSGRAPVPRETDDRCDDVLWNIVCTLLDLKPQGMAEMTALGAVFTERLVRQGFLSNASPPEARTGITGILRWLVSGQSVAGFTAERAMSQVRILKAFLRSVEANWPPRDAPWLDPMQRFASEMQAELAVLERLPPNEELQARVDVGMKRIEALAGISLDAVDGAFASRCGDAMTWLLGSLIEQNRFSPEEGPGAKAMYDGLVRIHYSLSERALAVYTVWFMERVPPGLLGDDELQRWWAP